MNEPENEIEAALEPFLSTRLTALGLDYETYGPYLLPVLTSAQDEVEEWESVLELLRASSETHSDDEQVWLTLRKDVEEKWKQYQAERDAQLKVQHEKEMQAYHQDLLKEREAARQAELIRQEEQQKIAAVKASAMEDAAKRALVERYAYENDDDDDDDDQGVDEDRPISNKEAAALAAQEQAREMRSHKKTTKREEQQKTAQAKMEKARLKEERRKKATKGERRR